ncbi:hypothetical protein OIV83_006379 [Microbotryomycetes sp. JL201]|nr:hypothetical protein OIV83_006379 [Microbotryomycetes sp. JL201]
MQMRIESLENELAQLQLEKNAKQEPSSQVYGIAPTAAQSAPADTFQGGLAINAHASRISFTGELRFYGPTSSYRAVIAEYSAVQKESVEAARALSLTRAPVRGSMPREPELPRRPPNLSPDMRSTLLKLAFEFCLSQFGLVDERKFMRDLENHPHYRTPHYSPFLLHVVLGIGCRYLDPAAQEILPELCSDPNDPSTRGDVFISWARYMIDQEWYHPDVSTVRALACLTVYLAGRGLDGPAYMYTGQAMKLAEDFGMQLGMHRLTIGAAEISDELVAARRDAFYSAYQIDVLLSMYIGRATSFIPDEIDLEMPPVDHEIEFDEPAYRSSAFTHSAKLIMLASRMMNSVYALLPKISLAQRQSAVPELHLELETWYRALPGPLRTAASTISNAPHPHIIGLNMLYHLIMITLHRPFFRRAKDNRQAVSTEKCLSSARHIVRLVKLQREAHGLRRVAPLFQHACFSCGTILALSAVEDGISGIHEKDVERRAQAKADLQTICAALREVAETWRTADTSANLDMNSSRTSLHAALMGQWAQPQRSGTRTGTQTPQAPHAPVTDQVEPSMDQIWPMMPTDSVTASFPFLFPSWQQSPLELGAGASSTYDDFLGILSEQPTSLEDQNIFTTLPQTGPTDGNALFGSYNQGLGDMHAGSVPGQSETIRF